MTAFGVRIAVYALLIIFLQTAGPSAHMDRKHSAPGSAKAPQASTPEVPPASAQAPLEFKNIAAQAGLTRSFPNGGLDSKTYIVETTGSGIAFLDYDNDGFLDIFVVSGPGESNRLYHNDQKGHFTDVTEQMGLTHTGWGQ